VLAAERRRQIIQLMERDHSVKVADLCERFGVADETIRRDLRQLEAEGLIDRTHGGAVLEQSLRIAYPYHLRKTQSPREKQLIGAAAAQLVLDGATVMLDNGTTAFEVARSLRGKSRLTVVTTSPLIALELADHRDTTVIMTAGVLDPDSKSLVGPDAEEFLKRLRVDIAFVGASGVSLERGFTASSVYDAQIKAVMITASSKQYVVADGSKIGQSSLVCFAQLPDVCGVVTDPSAPLGLLEELRCAGLDVVVAQ
jgi:DeoR/GlpR family transcriptional regulator of sugar metabolism